MTEDYDRYSKFRVDGEIKMVPFVEIPKQDSDMYVQYEKGRTRLDIISNDYYGNPNYGWLILQANPDVGSMEFSIKDNTMIRIPFPSDAALTAYKNGIDKYNKYYG